jgi:hypothetical protein
MNYHKIINYELSGYVENINIINPQGLINIEKLESTDKKNIDFLLTTTLLKDIDINNTDGSIRVEKVGSPRNNKVFFNISSTFKNGLSFKGSVDTFNDLPTTNLEIGDVYLVKDVMLFYC